MGEKGLFGIGILCFYFFLLFVYRLHELALLELGFTVLVWDSRIWGCGGNPQRGMENKRKCLDGVHSA